jgi:hypothetical protein
MKQTVIARTDLAKGDQIKGIYLRVVQNTTTGFNDIWFSIPYEVAADSELRVVIVKKRLKPCKTDKQQ